MHAPGPCGSLQRPLLWGWEFLLLPLQPPPVFSIRGLRRYFPHAGALGYAVCFAAPPFFLVYLCANVGPQGATRHSVCPILRHSESGPLGLSVCECRVAGSASGQTSWPVCPTLRQSRSRHSNAATRVLSTQLPVSTPPTGLDECFFFISLVLDFLAIRFPVSSGCARRRSVSTYAAIVVLCHTVLILEDL